MNKYWTEFEMEQIKTLTKEGFTESEISEKIGRSARAIESQRQMMCLGKDGMTVWTDQNVRALKFLIKQKDATNKSIASILGNDITEFDVQKRRNRLDL